MSGLRQVHNWAAGLIGTMHHDETATAKGFPAGLVPGDVHVALVTAELVERFGPPWYERGWLRFTFVAPAYNGEQLQTVVAAGERAEGDEDVVSLRLERPDGHLVCVGTAGLYSSAEGGAAPWERPDAPSPPASGDVDPLPREPVGTEYEPATPKPEVGWFDQSLAGNDDLEWYRTTSPWGPPVIPTVGPFSLAHRIRPTPAGAVAAMKSGMNAGFEVVHLGAMPHGRRYRRSARLAGKGTAGRYSFRSVDFEMADLERPDTTLFRGRWRIKWVSPTPPH